MKQLPLLLIVYLLGGLVNAQEYKYPFQDPCRSAEERADDLLSRMTPEEKITQMVDRSAAIDRLGIEEYNWWNECLHGVARSGAATSFPQAVGMAATWNDQLINQVADAISTEARAKFNENIRQGKRGRYEGLTMWTPNINIFRDPRWGRGQETYGEDPYLTSRLGVAFVKGLQGDNPDYYKVVATPKHYAVHSGPEPNRHSFDAYTDMRDLWETYLPAFEATVKEGQAFSVMSAYNRYLGESCTASDFLLNKILRDQWGFKGYVVSDCGAVYDIYKFHNIVPTAEEAAALSVKSGCDLNCGSTFKALDKALKKGLITEKEIDVALKRLIIAKIKLGLLDPPEKVPFATIPYEKNECKEHQDLALETTKQSIVLLKNENNTLPLRTDIRSITVVGPNANDKNFLLGNYFGIPTHYSTVLDGIKQAVSSKTKVHYFKGCNLADTNPPIDVVHTSFFQKETLKAEYYTNAQMEGKPVFSGTVKLIDFDWGGAAPIPQLKPEEYSIRYTGKLIPKETGEFDLSVASKGGFYRVFVNDEILLNNWEKQDSASHRKTISLEKGKKYDIRLEYWCKNPWLSKIQLNWLTPSARNNDILIQQAGQSDAIVFVGGISAALEGEEMPVKVDGFKGGDRTHLKLPKVQEDLLEKLHATGKPVIFLLTTGSAMAINWEQEHLPAIMNIWYPGQAGGKAVADILFGKSSPSGKLPVTFYKSVNDLPPFEDYHMAGRTYKYFEGTPLYPFGFGLSYSSFMISKPELSKKTITSNESVTVNVLVTNSGDYNAHETVQVYVKDLQSSVPKPIKSLRKFKKIFLKKGESQTLEFTLDPADFSVRDAQGKPFVEAGVFEILIGDNSETTNKSTLRITK
ncbi:beta-glucosidase [Puteibacter caeruleilacunae]|nr:beta-glucosidase [Puteibacter caeruleilacunae]